MFDVTAGFGPAVFVVSGGCLANTGCDRSPGLEIHAIRSLQAIEHQSAGDRATGLVEYSKNLIFASLGDCVPPAAHDLTRCVIKLASEP